MQGRLLWPPLQVVIFFAMSLTAILSPLYRWLMGKGLQKGWL
ncbi:MAG: hypothetical protein R6X34_30415 [Chloroflexota bacterium]